MEKSASKTNFLFWLPLILASGCVIWIGAVHYWDAIVPFMLILLLVPLQLLLIVIRFLNRLVQSDSPKMDTSEYEAKLMETVRQKPQSRVL